MGNFLFMAAILDFCNRVWIKILETAFFVFFVNLRTEKLQVSKIYMKSWPNYTMTYTTRCESIESHALNNDNDVTTNF